MDEYSIRLASRMTGLPPDTLRVWERRYGFPKPRRSEGGSRVYQREDVLALKLIVRAIELGYRPGEIVGKPRRELESLLRDAATAETAVGPPRPTPERVLRALLRDDVVGLRAEMSRAASILGPRKFVAEFAHPASVRVGEAWAAGSLEVRHEHVFTASLSRQLHVMLSAIDENVHGARVLLATLPNESHGLALDMIALYLAAQGMVPRVVGVDTPPEQIAAAAVAYDCDVVGLSMTASFNAKEAQVQLRSLLKALPRRTRLWIGGAGARHLHLEAKERSVVTTVSDFSALDAAMTSLAVRTARMTSPSPVRMKE